MRRRSDPGGSRRKRRSAALAAGGTVLLIAASALPGSAANAPPAQRSGTAADLNRITVLAERQLSRPAGRLAKALPGEARRVRDLGDPAATVEAQLRIALDELRAMSALRYDSHYLPALLATGRAYMAATGRDPVTGTGVDPGYAGLRRELGTGAADLLRDAKTAKRVARTARRLTAMLRRAKRRVRRAERQTKRGEPRRLAPRRR